ncbi:MAG: hypothetical protein V4565_00835 [Bacteroidota bacterium]
MKHIIKIFALAIIALLTNSCKKSSTGGDATVVAFPKHHGTPIKGATIYIKFNAKDLPSDPTSNYDLKVVGEENEDHVHIKGLRYGQYYLYAVGYDESISETVVGGMALAIKYKQRKKEIDVDIAVSED